MQLYKKTPMPTQRKLSNQQCTIPSKYYNTRRKSKNKNLLWRLRYSIQAQICEPLENIQQYQIPNWYKNIKQILEYNISKTNLEDFLEPHKSYNQSPKRCLLCLNEKLAIALHKDDNMLNKRSEIIIKCRHRNKYMPAIYDRKD